MFKNRKFLVIIVVVILAVLAAVLLVRNNNKSNTSSTEPVDTQPTAYVSITDTGFVPATLKIKSGSNVVWTNNGVNGHWVITGPHSSHDSLKGLDSKAKLPTNGTYTYQFTTAGTYNYHDETDPTHNGTIIVE